MSKLFKYPLTDSQYHRFVDDPDTLREINLLGKQVGTMVWNNNDGNWLFNGDFAGTAGLKNVNNVWYCWVKVDKKPWFIPWFLVDYGFKTALV